ncbi:MAG TPA: hypothetical protein VHV77_11015 [Pirellulales bacterium]|nr:hypothetical protein [Pirellulales bacterium]
MAAHFADSNSSVLNKSARVSSMNDVKRLLIAVSIALCAIYFSGCASGLVGSGGDFPSGDDNRSFHDANDQARAAEADAAAQNANDAILAASSAAAAAASQ